MGELPPEAYLPKGKLRRRVRKVEGEKFHEQFAINEEESKRKRNTLWCKSCGKYRLWKEVQFEYYIYKDSWWRKTICNFCSDILKDEALE